jgi:uncharacterized protein with FMN-binding domain
MKKSLISFATVIAFTFYAVLFRFVDSPKSEQVNIASTGTGSTTASTSLSSTGTPLAKIVATTSAFRDGQYLGQAANAYYGIIQVRAVVNGGKLVDIQFLSFPNDRPHSRELSTQVLPILAREAISRQSAQVDTVSGATETSAAFVRSLSGALAEARS